MISPSPYRTSRPCPSRPRRGATRRRATAGLLVAGAVALAGSVAPAAHAQTEAPATNDDVSYLYAAAVGERIAREAYRVGARRLRADERAAFVAAGRSKSTAIRELSRAIGEDAPTDADLKIVLPAKRTADRTAVLELVRELETLLVGFGRRGLADVVTPNARRSLSGTTLTNAQLLSQVRGFQGRNPLRVPGRVSVETFGRTIDGFLADPDQTA